MNHFTDKAGWNAIRAAPTWRFKAFQPPQKAHPVGAYFTTLGPNEPNLFSKIRVPKVKQMYLFSFLDVGDLKPLDSDRGAWIFYSPTDYDVGRERQTYQGEAGES